MHRIVAISIYCFCSGALALEVPSVARADAPTVRYDLNISDPQAHVYHVSVSVSGLARPSTVLQMPIWIPGYYSNDQYGRNVLSFGATDASGKSLAWRRDGQSTYIVDTVGVSSISVRYDLFANRQADIGTQLSAERALFNGAETFMYVKNDDGYPSPGSVALTIHKPNAWKMASGLLALQTGVETFTAPSYDVLVDCPTDIAPRLNEADFAINGVTYHLVIDGPGNYDVHKMAPVAKQIIASEVKMFGHAAYKEYWAIFLTNAGGGMEHLNSTLSGMAPYGWEQPHDAAASGFGGGPWNEFALVLAHEHYHSWNVKRIRPSVLGPFRYDQEVHTRRLDVAEGWTEYYTFVHGLRSGFSSPKATWTAFADDIQTEETSPGRRLFSLGDLSWNTWWGNDDPYIPGGDYYDGAAIMAFMLDLKIRHDTSSAHSLDDVQRSLFADWESKSLDAFRSPGGTYADDAMPSIIANVTGDAEAGTLFHRWWDTLQLPDWNTYLGYAGLKLVKTQPKPGKATLDAGWDEVGAPDGIGFVPRRGAKLQYGLPEINPDEVMISRVLPGGAAERAGIEQFDVLQGLGGLAVTRESLPAILAMHRAGDRLPAIVLREGRLVTLQLTLGQDHIPTYSIEERRDATPAQRKLREQYQAGIPFRK